MKETSYSRLKRELLETKQKLRQVCLHPESKDAFYIVADEKFAGMKEKALMMGEQTKTVTTDCAFGIQIMSAS